MQDSSAYLRECGNKEYLRSRQEGLSSCLQRQRLEQALLYYNRALKAASCPEDQASCCKNLAKAHWRLSELNYSTEGAAQLASPSSLARYHAFQAMDHVQAAVKKARGSLPEAWLNDMETFRASTTYTVLSWIRQLSDRQHRIPQLVQVGSLASAVTQAEVLLEASTNQFFLAITLADDSTRMTSALSYAEQLLAQAERHRSSLPQDNDLEERMSSMRESIFHHQTICESAFWRKRGEILLEKALAELDGQMIELVWDAADMFKQSIIMARERDLESEAISSSRLGDIFEQCLKLKTTAKMYYKHAVQVAHSLSPRDFTNAPWYAKAEKALKRYQDEVVHQEQNELNAERAKYETELQPIFLQLRVADVSPEELLRFVYAKYPPKNPDHRLQEENLLTNRKKAIQSAMIHYHPDKQPSGQDKPSRVWFFVAEEISKLLTAHYNVIKG